MQRLWPIYIGETGRNLKQRPNEHDRAIRLGRVTQSARACHCLQSGHKFDFDGIRVPDTTSNKRHRLILEAWQVKSRKGGRTGETVDIPTQYTHVILMVKKKMDGANSWIRWPTNNNTQPQTPHPHVHNTQREPQHVHNQHPIMPNTKTTNAHTCSPTHIQHQILCK